MKDYYKILEVNCDSSRDEIKKSYRKLAKQWHPDVNKSENAHEKFVEITEAYEILINDYNREQYDAIRNSSHYSQKHNDFSRKQQNARQKGKYYSTISFEEFLQKAFEIFVEVGKTTLYGEDEFNKSLKFNNYLKIGVKGWLSVLLIILTFTGVLAPVTIPILLRINLIDDKKEKIVGIKNIFIGMFIFAGVFLGVILGFYIICNLEDVFYYTYYLFTDFVSILILLIIIAIIVGFLKNNEKIDLSFTNFIDYIEKKGYGIKDFSGLFFWILSIFFTFLADNEEISPVMNLIAAGLSLFFFPMAIFFWLFMSKYKNFFIRLLTGIIFFFITAFIIINFDY